MSPKEVKEGLVNLKALGSYLKAMRKAAGFDRAEDFAKALESKTGYFCKKDFIYRIESGKQEPPLTYLCAVSLTLSEHVFSVDMWQTVQKCVCPSWQEIETRARRSRNLDEYRRLKKDGVTCSFSKDGYIEFEPF